MISKSCYLWNMVEAPEHDWFLREWMTQRPLKAARIGELLGWQKSKVSRLVNGKTPYDRDIVNALSKLLDIEPYELLMHPRDALAMRQIRESVYRIAAEARQSYIPEPERDGTHG